METLKAYGCGNTSRKWVFICFNVCKMLEGKFQGSGLSGLAHLILSK